MQSFCTPSIIKLVKQEVSSELSLLLGTKAQAIICTVSSELSGSSLQNKRVARNSAAKEQFRLLHMTVTLPQGLNAELS
jgi:hypothetical protein